MTQYNALKYPIRIVQGNDWILALTISLRVNEVKTPADISTTTFDGFVRVNRDDETNAEDMAFSITDAANGRVTVSLTDAQTLALPLGDLYYQIDKTVDNITQTILAGQFNVR